MTTSTAVLAIVATTPAPIKLKKTSCIPCVAKPPQSVWTGVIDCEFECLNGTQRIDEKCVMCDNARAPNSTWLVDCEWSCGRGFRQVEGQCLGCAQSKPLNATWSAAAECEWECAPGFVLFQGDCTACRIGKDFRSHWTSACLWECNAGFSRNSAGCAQCDMGKDVNSIWSSATGCDWQCNAGYAAHEGICKPCTNELDGRGRWTPENEEKKCLWACNDGYFLLEPNENRISQPMAIVLGAVGGVLLGLILFRVCCWKRARNSGRSGAVDEARQKGQSLYLIPISQPESAPLDDKGKVDLTMGTVVGLVPAPQEEKGPTPEEQRIVEKEARQLRRARNKVQDMVAHVALLVNRSSGSVDNEGDEIAI
mmetsp:Transcript_986/g.1619  ORF Transcript_986/g.1619 Transcript_986/m.1619 type:complete len:367 (+) Transcript_986:43-1143(+)